MSEKKSRQLNMEILRIVAMFMIITLHYLDKGGILREFNETPSLFHEIAWIIEAFAMVSVNIYVLISGYFLAESEFKLKKLILLWVQIILYSWIITAIVAIAGGQIIGENGVYDLIPLLLPVTGSHYWFATIYVLMYACFPFFNKAIKAMNKKQHKTAIIVSVVIFSLWNTFLPMTIPVTDNDGMDICWFAVLYLIAAYLRKYGEDIKINKWLALLTYVVSSLLIYGLGKGLLVADMVIGKLGGFAENFYPYNSLFTLAGSLGLFIFFMKTEFKLPKWVGRVTLWASAGCFGVYLLHEHRLIRYEWPKLFNTEKYADTPVFLLNMILAIICVFVAGITIDYVRRLITGLFMKIGGRKND